MSVDCFYLLVVVATVKLTINIAQLLRRKRNAIVINILVGVAGIHGLTIDRTSFIRYITFSNQMDIKKVLVVSKLSRYDFERYKYKNLTQSDFHNVIKERGSDLDKLLYYHELHKNFEHRVVNAFRNMGIVVEVANK